MKFIYTILLLTIFSSCIKKTINQSINSNFKPVELKYAKGFTIYKGNQYTVISVLNPWKKGEIYDKYYLVNNDSIQLPPDGKKVLIPLKNMVVNSATHLEFIQLLNQIEKIIGICNTQYIYNPFVLKRYQENKIKDLGDAFNIDIENLILLKPQIVMTSAYNVEDENSKRLERTGIPVIYNIEWQEKTPLGRAEWIKFVGAFFNKEQEADSIFTKVEENYNELKSKVAGLTKVPNILSGQDFRGTWSMPAGQSFNAQLFRDAGCHYYYSNDTTLSGSIPSDIENALIHFKDADVWIGSQANTLTELEKTDPKYKLFKAFKEKNVYNYNNRMNSTGGNDYWESAVARPDLLLSDLIKVFHPQLLPGYKLFYMKKLK